jgi:hypothetical protein
MGWTERQVNIPEKTQINLRLINSIRSHPKVAEVAQPGRALDSKPQGLRAKLKTGSSPVQTRPSAPQMNPLLSAPVRVKLK